MGRPALAACDILPLYADVLRDWLTEGRPLRVRVTGGSMRPTIDDGSEILLEACAPDAIRAGDVVVYEDGARLVCHRVLHRRRVAGRWCVLTSGDAVRLPPAWIAAQAVIGRVIAVEGHGGVRRLVGSLPRVRARVAVVRAWLGLASRRVRRAMDVA